MNLIPKAKRHLNTLLLPLLLCTGGLALTNCNAQTTPETATQQVTYANLSPEEFKAKMTEENVVILDVRTPGEVAGGKIEGAKELDYRATNFEQELLNLDPEKTYLVYCASGGRSSNACEKMVQNGYQKVYNLRGGYKAWRQ